MTDYVLTIGPITIPEITVRLSLGMALSGNVGGGGSPGNARLAAAMANPTPRTVAGVDPIAAQSVSGTTQLPAGNEYDVASGKIRFIHGKGVYSFASVYGVTQFGNGGISGPVGCEVVCTGRYLEFNIRNDSGELHVFVDGVLTRALAYTPLSGAPGYIYWRLDFATAATRRVRVLMDDNNKFGPVRTDGVLLDPTPPYPCNALMMGDSFWEPAFPVYRMGGLPVLLAENLGISNAIPTATGGRGFVNRNTQENFADRAVADLALAPIDDPQIDLIVIAATGNDSGANGYGSGGAALTREEWEALYATNVNFVLATARAAWPNAAVVVLDFAIKDDLSMNADAMFMAGVLEAACTTNNCIWAPGVTAAVAALAPEVRESWYHVDGHPNDAGHIGLAGIMDTLIRAALA